MWARICSRDLSIRENDGWELCLHNRSLTLPEELRGPWCLFARFSSSWRELEAGEVMICGSHGTHGMHSLLNSSFHLVILMLPHNSSGDCWLPVWRGR